MLTKSFLREVETIHNDTQSGAVKIASTCLKALKNECFRTIPKLEESVISSAIQLLLDTHPMATIENALLPVYLQLVRLIETKESKIGDLKTKIDLIFSTRQVQMSIVEEKTIETLSKFLQKLESILTFSYSSTVTNALLKLAKKGFQDKIIYILESRPLREGEELVRTILKAGFKNVHLGIDFAVNEFSNCAEAAVFGADMIHSNGGVLNKIGSATIAEIFHLRSKKVIVAASSSKICLNPVLNGRNEWHPFIPNRSVKNITDISNTNLTVWNKYFEVVHPKCISSLIMDGEQFISPISIQFSKFLEKNPVSNKLFEIRKIWK